MYWLFFLYHIYIFFLKAEEQKNDYGLYNDKEEKDFIEKKRIEIAGRILKEKEQKKGDIDCTCNETYKKDFSGKNKNNIENIEEKDLKKESHKKKKNKETGKKQYLEHPFKKTKDWDMKKIEKKKKENIYENEFIEEESFSKEDVDDEKLAIKAAKEEDEKKDEEKENINAFETPEKEEQSSFLIAENAFLFISFVVILYFN